MCYLSFFLLLLASFTYDAYPLHGGSGVLGAEGLFDFQLAHVCLVKPKHCSADHWSAHKHLITEDARQIILGLPNHVKSIVVPNCPVSALVAGLLLGDAGIHRSGKHHRLELHLHLSQKSLAFMALTCMFLEHVGLGKGIIRLYQEHSKGEVRWNLKCYSTAKPIWTEARQFWYPKGIKVVPLSIGQLISELGVACLIMGDGARMGGSMYSGSAIYVNAFSLAEVELLSEYLRQQYGVSFVASPRTAKKDGTAAYRLATNYNDSRLLGARLAKYIHPSWHYKFAS
jgi:hypothetical protein